MGNYMHFNIRSYYRKFDVATLAKSARNVENHSTSLLALVTDSSGSGRNYSREFLVYDENTFRINSNSSFRGLVTTRCRITLGVKGSVKEALKANRHLSIFQLAERH